MDYENIEDFLTTNIGFEIEEWCPNCNERLLGNRRGDKWCSSENCCWANSKELVDLCVELGGVRPTMPINATAEAAHSPQDASPGQG